MTQEDDRQLPQQKNLREEADKAEAEKQSVHRRESNSGAPLSASIGFALAVAGALSLLILTPARQGSVLAAQLVWVAFVGAIAFLVLWTGRVARWRSLFFVVLAWSFILYFKPGALGLRESAIISPEAKEVPYCHIAIASSILNYAYYEYLAFKSGHWLQWGPLSLGFLWLVVTLAVGQAWCSWVCVYGGLDDGFSRILSRPALRWLRLPGHLRELPAGVLLFSVLLSLTSLLPVFCLWVCPLKITTGFLDTNDAVRRIQLTLFVFIGISAIVAVPVLTKKRVFCGLLCPFGAWQSFWGKLNPFRVTIFADRCTHCQLCVKACPTFSIPQVGPGSYAISPYCNRCGECIDVCRTDAIAYTILGREPRLARILFLFAVLTLGGAIGGLFIPELLGGWLGAR